MSGKAILGEFRLVGCCWTQRGRMNFERLDLTY